MAYDLEYIAVQCNHRVFDEVIYTPGTLGYALAAKGSYFDKDLFGNNKFDANYYAYALIKEMELGEINGLPYVIITPNHTMTGSLRIFYKDPEDYLRTELPQVTYAALTTDRYYGQYFWNYSSQLPTLLVNSEDPIQLYYYNTTSYDMVVQQYGAFFTVPPNSILIFAFDASVEWLLDYNIVTDECPFCGGTGITNDLTITAAGDVSLVYNTDKLAQLVLKAILTPKGTNRYFPSYGTEIMNMLGNKALNNSFSIRFEIIDQLRTIKAVQAAIAKNSPTFFTPSEILEDITSIELSNASSPMSINIAVNCICRSLDTVRTKPYTLTF